MKSKYSAILIFLGFRPSLNKEEKKIKKAIEKIKRIEDNNYIITDYSIGVNHLSKKFFDNNEAFFKLYDKK